MESAWRIVVKHVSAATLIASASSLVGCAVQSKRAAGAPALAPRAAAGTYVADYIETQGGASSLNRDAERATLLTRTGEATARGELGARDLHFLLDGVRPGEPAGFEISTAGFAALVCARAELRSLSGRPVTYRLLVYKNPARVKLLHQTTFRSERPPHSVDVPLQGAVDVWLVWEAVGGRSQHSAEFVMTAPRLTAGDQGG